MDDKDLIVSPAEAGQTELHATGGGEDFDFADSAWTYEGEAPPETGNALVRAGKSAVKGVMDLLGLGQKGNEVPGKEKISYYTYFAGQNLIYSLVSVYLTTFAILQGMDGDKVALVLLLVKIWDAFNDAIFGALFDKLKLKGGKFMPWLRMSVVAIPISVILLYAIPANIPEAAQLAWLAIAYLIHDCAYTLCDAPIHGVVTVLSNNFGEREKMLSVKGLCGTAGGGIASLLAMVLVSQSVGMSYFYVAILGSVIAFVFMVPFCFLGKERTLPPPSEEKFTLRRMFKYLFSNKYLLIYYIAFLFSSITLYKTCLLITVGINLLIFLFAKGNVGAYIGLSVANAISTGVTSVLLFMFTPDCAEYGRFKTGIDAKGITFSLQTLMAKITGALQGSLGLFLIGLFGWHEIEGGAASFKELAEKGVTQTPAAIDGLWFTCIVVPLVGNFIAFLILQLYRLKDRDVKIMMRCNAGDITREEALMRIKAKL